MYRYRNWRGQREYKKEWYFYQKSNETLLPLPLRIDYCGTSICKSAFHQMHSRYDRLGLEFIQSGNSVFFQHQMKWEIGPGNVIIKLPGKPHRYHSADPSGIKKRFMGINGPILSQLLQSSGLLNKVFFKPADFNHVNQFFHRAITLLNAQPANAMERLSLLAYEIILYLTRETAHMDYPPTLAKAMDLISNDIHIHWNYQNLAKAVNESPGRIKSIFEHHTGTCLSSYLLNKRISFAKQMLQDQDHSIKEISIEVGYNDPLYFSRRFHQIEGQSPSDFRKNSLERKD